MPKNSKIIVFDTGPVISLVMNNLLWILDDLKKVFEGQFVITPSVRTELVDKPFDIKKFKFEALQVLASIDRGIFEVADLRPIRSDAQDLLDLANHIFKTKGNWVRIVSPAEMEVLACAIAYDASAAVVDERTTRLLVEAADDLHGYMEAKLHMPIQVERKNLARFRKITKGIRMIRSTELVLIAYELGLLDKYLPDMPEPKKQLLQAVLWGVKLNGCAVSQEEIDTVVDLEIARK